MKQTVAAIYTSQALVIPVSDAFPELVPGVRLVNIADDSLIQDVIAANEVPPAVERRLLRYFMACEDLGADLILNTCSSIGEASMRIARYINLPIMNIDDAMAGAVVQEVGTVAVLATLPSTLGPTVRLIRQHAESAGVTIEIVEGLAPGAFEALISGDAAKHDQILLETACRIARNAEAVVLAQGSMARMHAVLESNAGVKVFSSIRSGLASVHARLTESSARVPNV